MNQPKWDVEEQAILGIFSFSKFIMWNDIHSNADKLYENKIVKSLVTGRLEWEVEDDSDLNLDADLKPSDITLAISADSFQMEAVLAASQSKSFILHGPPGTGKSQTITNIIVDALYKGKKVLFVAEKMAALSVVQKRLKAIGIDPFCLELHSNKSKKSAILAQLQARTEVLCRKSPEEYSSESERIHLLRSELSTYAEVLHQKQPSGYSLYDALYGYSQETHIQSDFELSSDLVCMFSSAKILLWRDALEEAQASAILCKSISGHPLLCIERSDFSQSIRSEARDLLIKYISSLESCLANLPGCLHIFGKEIVCTTKVHLELLNDLADFWLKRPIISYLLLKENISSETISHITQILPHGKLRDSLRSSLLSEFKRDILSIGAAELLDAWDISEDKWFLPKYFAQNKILKALKIFSLKKGPSKKRIEEILTTIIHYHKEEQIIHSKNSQYNGILEFLWNDGECDWNHLEEYCKSSLWLNQNLLGLTGDIVLYRKVRNLISDNISQGIDTFLTIHKEPLSKFAESFGVMMDLYNQLSFKLEITEKYKIHEPWLNYKIEQANIWLNNIELLRDWFNWNSSRKRAIDLGLEPFMEYLCTQPLDPNQIISAFNKALFKGIISQIIDCEPILSKFNGKLFEDKILKFKKLTQNFEDLTREELFAKLASNIPSFVQAAAQSSEVGILQRNIRNNGRGTSIRKLFDTIPTLLTRMTPCMLMSPISVAQYIDVNNIKFDLVIFDEASQMPTCEAVGAIARGRNVIVVGDPKQLPPTNFFSTNNVDEDNIEKEDLESILDDCLALTMPSKHLLWHYRSKHESLIAFSNLQYYENKLLTFPSPDDIQSKVTYTQIPGYYDKGKSRQNRSEAEAVVKEVLARLADKELSLRSIGVVTFSSVQQILIEDLLNEAFVRNPKLEVIAMECVEPIFIKNLENVQGDERDVILFSIGYGPDKEGKVSLNFGPLNREGGWRRLNVAVSRARYEMKVFSTLRAEQIDLTRTNSEGVKGLKAFLEYAEKGKNVIAYDANSQKIRQKSLVDVIANKIREEGFEVNTNIGCSGYRVDIGVINPKKPTEYSLGILCDGANYKAAKTVRDREIIQQEVLKLLGWNIHRLWALDWWENEERVLAEITNAISKSPINVKQEIRPNAGTEFKHRAGFDPLVIATINKIPIGTLESKYCTTYFHSNLKIVPLTFEEFLDPYKSDLVKRQIMQVLDSEGPISYDLLCKRILSAWSIARKGNRIDAYITDLILQLELTCSNSCGKRFVWKPDQLPNEYMHYRISERAADDISSEEISVAVKEVLEQQISLSTEDLIKETSKLLRFGRLGTSVEASMQSGIKMAIKRGFAKDDHGRIALND